MQAETEPSVPKKTYPYKGRAPTSMVMMVDESYSDWSCLEHPAVLSSTWGRQFTQVHDFLSNCKPLAYSPKLALALGDVKSAVYFSYVLFMVAHGNSDDGCIGLEQNKATLKTGFTRRETDRIRQDLKALGIVFEQPKKFKQDEMRIGIRFPALNAFLAEKLQIESKLDLDVVREAPIAIKHTFPPHNLYFKELAQKFDSALQSLLIHRLIYLQAQSLRREVWSSLTDEQTAQPGWFEFRAVEWADWLGFKFKHIHKIKHKSCQNGIINEKVNSVNSRCSLLQLYLNSIVNYGISNDDAEIDSENPHSSQIVHKAKPSPIVPFAPTPSNSNDDAEIDSENPHSSQIVHKAKPSPIVPFAPIPSNSNDDEKVSPSSHAQADMPSHTRPENHNTNTGYLIQPLQIQNTNTLTISNSGFKSNDAERPPVVVVDDKYGVENRDTEDVQIAIRSGHIPQMLSIESELLAIPNFEGLVLSPTFPFARISSLEKKQEILDEVVGQMRLAAKGLRKPIINPLGLIRKLTQLSLLNQFHAEHAHGVYEAREGRATQMEREDYLQNRFLNSDVQKPFNSTQATSVKKVAEFEVDQKSMSPEQIEAQWLQDWGKLCGPTIATLTMHRLSTGQKQRDLEATLSLRRPAFQALWQSKPASMTVENSPQITALGRGKVLEWLLADRSLEPSSTPSLLTKSPRPSFKLNFAPMGRSVSPGGIGQPSLPRTMKDSVPFKTNGNALGEHA
jgi:hypothetical protein